MLSSDDNFKLCEEYDCKNLRRWAIGIGAAIFLLFIGLNMCSSAQAQHSNWDWIGSGFQVQTNVRQPSVTARSYVNVGPIEARSGIGLSLFSASWLEANLGATAPAGAPGAWCGYAMRLESVTLGFGDPGPAFNVVSSWCTRGSAVPPGTIGAVAVSAGHVSKVVMGDCPAHTVATISGNATGRRVAYMCEPIASIRCWRSMG